jgi:hypothetical protein
MRDPIAIRVERGRDEGWMSEKVAQPEVIVATNTKPGFVTAPEEQDDAQLTLLTAISAFRDSTCPLFISTLKTFEKALLAAQKFYEGHEYAIGELHERLLRKFHSLTGLTPFFCCAFLTSGGNSTPMGRAF